jgi:hypothetical protein
MLTVYVIGFIATAWWAYGNQIDSEGVTFGDALKYGAIWPALAVVMVILIGGACMASLRNRWRN